MNKHKVFVFPKCIIHKVMKTKKCLKTKQIRDTFCDNNFFVNVPYIESYVELEIAVWVTLYLHGFSPLMARDERTEEIRLCRICSMILRSNYCLTDFSHKRLNVALEHGLAIAAGKPSVVMVDERYIFDEILSDWKFVDPIGHNMDPEKLIFDLCQWIKHNIKSARLFVNGHKNVSKVYLQAMMAYSAKYSYSSLRIFYEDVVEILEVIDSSEIDILKAAIAAGKEGRKASKKIIQNGKNGH